jgi:hypothetical protein
MILWMLGSLVASFLVTGSVLKASGLGIHPLGFLIPYFVHTFRTRTHMKAVLTAVELVTDLLRFTMFPAHFCTLPYS